MNKEVEAAFCPACPDVPAEQSWPCSYCTYHNGQRRKTCGLCGLERDYAGRLEDVDLERLEANRENILLDEQGDGEAPTTSQALLAVVPARRILNGALRGIFALAGSFAGAVAGAVAAHSSRGGLVRGIGLGALAGAIVSMEALETSPLLFHTQQRNSQSLVYRPIQGGVTINNSLTGSRTIASGGDASGNEQPDAGSATAASTSGSNREAESTTRNGRGGRGILNLLSPLSGLQIRVMHWRMLSLDAGLEFALREMRIPPEALFRISSNTNRNPFAYPTSDITEGILARRTYGGRSLLLQNSQTGNATATTTASSVPGLSPSQLRKLPYKILEVEEKNSSEASTSAHTEEEEEQEQQMGEQEMRERRLKYFDGQKERPSPQIIDDDKAQDVTAATTVRVQERAEEKKCAICFECFKPGEHVRVLPTCNHDFHARCLDPWLRKKGSCPMCRRPAIEEDQD
jgi:hypothetical protein